MSHVVVTIHYHVIREIYLIGLLRVLYKLIPIKCLEECLTCINSKQSVNLIYTYDGMLIINQEGGIMGMKRSPNQGLKNCSSGRLKGLE